MIRHQKHLETDAQQDNENGTSSFRFLTLLNTLTGFGLGPCRTDFSLW